MRRVIWDSCDQPTESLVLLTSYYEDMYDTETSLWFGASGTFYQCEAKPQGPLVQVPDGQWFRANRTEEVR